MFPRFADPVGSGADVYVDAQGLAAVADRIGRAATTTSQARDWINAAWRRARAAFGSSPTQSAMDECCRVWVTGTNAVALFVDALAHYTQNIAIAYGATDAALAAGATAIYDSSDLPQPGRTYSIAGPADML